MDRQLPDEDWSTCGQWRSQEVEVGGAKSQSPLLTPPLPSSPPLSFPPLPSPAASDFGAF